MAHPPCGSVNLAQALSPDGKWALSFLSTSPPQLVLLPTGVGESKPLKTEGINDFGFVFSGMAPDDLPIRWSADGRALYVYPRGELPAKVYRFDLATQRKELWKQIMPSDPAGIFDITFIQVTPDGKSYAYTYGRLLSDLYLVEGLK